MKKGSIAFGVLLVMIGSIIIVTPKVKTAFVAGYFDFTGFNILLGALFVTASLACIWLSLPTRGRKVPVTHLICPTCQTVQTFAEGRASRCIKCGVGLENLHGFYDRHPELKDRT
jgi:hypothetical protein